MAGTRLSVVVPCSNGCARAGETLEALREATTGISAEVLLVDGCSDGSAEAALRKGPARRIAARPGTNAAGLRAVGIESSSGEIVALVEPWTRPAPGWGRAILETHRAAGKSAVVGGPVVYAGPRRSGAWAEFLFEYGGFLPPVPKHAAELPVNNVSYPSELLDRFRASWRGGFWKHFVHRELRASGVPFVSAPEALVEHARTVPFLRFCGERFHHGRAYAARRAASPARALLAPFLPGLLAARLAREVMPKPGMTPVFLRALPLLLLAQGMWAAGEAVGYLAEDGGSSAHVF